MKWNKIKLADVTEVITKGTTPTTIGYNYTDTGINFVKVEAISNESTFLLDRLAYISEECNNKMSRSQLRENDILFSIAGAIGRTAIVRKDILPANTNQALAIIRLNTKDITPEFLLLSLKGEYIYKQFNKKKQGVAQINLSLKDISELEILYPPIYEQNKIVEVLDKAQELIDKRKEQIEALDELVKSRFVEMFGDLYNNPKGWRKETFGEIVTIERGGSPRPINEYITDDINGINWIKIGDTSQNSMYIKSTKEKIKPEGIKKSRYVKEGDLLLSNSMSFGRPYILKTDGCIHDGWLVIRDDYSVFNKIYLCTALGSEAIYNQFKSMAVGGVVNNLNKEMVKGLSVCIPPIELQNQFADFVKQVDKLKSQMETSLKELEDNFNSLMQKAFKGELF